MTDAGYYPSLWGSYVFQGACNYFRRNNVSEWVEGIINTECLTELNMYPVAYVVSSLNNQALMKP